LPELRQTDHPRLLGPVPEQPEPAFDRPASLPEQRLAPERAHHRHSLRRSISLSLTRREFRPAWLGQQVARQAVRLAHRTDQRLLGEQRPARQAVRPERQMDRPQQAQLVEQRAEWLVRQMDRQQRAELPTWRRHRMDRRWRLAELQA
jgi:hypothetical protein